MADDLDELRDAIVGSLFSGAFPSAVLWGALVGGVLAIVEYNLSTAGGGGAEVGNYAIAAGVVAAVLYCGDRRGAQRAGAFAAGLPTLVLGPLSYLLLIAEGAVFTAGLEWFLLASAFLLVVVVPIVVGFSMLFGAISAHVAHWTLDELFGWKPEEDEEPSAR